MNTAQLEPLDTEVLEIPDTEETIPSLKHDKVVDATRTQVRKLTPEQEIIWSKKSNKRLFHNGPLEEVA